MIVAVLEWHDAGGQQSRAFGPWEPVDDHSHLDAISDWYKAWSAAHRVNPRLTLYVVQEPTLPPPFPGRTPDYSGQPTSQPGQPIG